MNRVGYTILDEQFGSRAIHRFLLRLRTLRILGLDAIYPLLRMMRYGFELFRVRVADIKMVDTFPHLNFTLSAIGTMTLFLYRIRIGGLGIGVIDQVYKFSKIRKCHTILLKTISTAEVISNSWLAFTYFLLAPAIGRGFLLHCALSRRFYKGWQSDFHPFMTKEPTVANNTCKRGMLA